jgi:hypothetical protein
MTPRMCAAVAGVVVFCGAFSSVSAGAQAPQAGTLTAAVSGIVAVPTGALIGSRGVGGGGAFALRYAPTAWPDVAVRIELSGLWPSSRDNNPPDESPVTANGNSTLSVLAGPEYDVPVLGGRFYASAAAGAAHIWATSSASSAPTPAYGPFNTTTDRQATNFAWSGGGGYMTGRSSSGVAGIFGVRYYDLGQATYVTTIPSLTFFPDTPIPAHSTVARHRVTFVAPSIGLSWRP